jgi:hypothetical protein
MIGKDYFARQATTLLLMAKAARDPQISAGLAVKAADMKSQLDEAPPQSDLSPTPPDVEVPK